MFKPGSIISCNSPKDFVLMSVPEVTRLYYAKLSKNNVIVEVGSTLDDYYAIPTCLVCNFTRYYKVSDFETVINPRVEEFCRDHQHVAALDRINMETNGQQ